MKKYKINNKIYNNKINKMDRKKRFIQIISKQKNRVQNKEFYLMIKKDLNKFYLICYKIQFKIQLKDILE
jgi:hypothetical protein